MLLTNLDLGSLLALVVALGVGISVHEAAHAFVADLLGDSTAKNQGRVTLNPLAHLDPLGTVLLFVAGFGWGRPVPVNPRAFSRPALDEFLVALAGPASNLLTAALLGLAVQWLVPPAGLLAGILVITIQINLFLMLFNLIPIPPLDGSKVLHILFGESVYEWLQLAALPLMLLLLVLLQSTPLGSTIAGLASTLTRFFLGQ
ncbi:site-2 protease family protein [Candidatus Berkelbacteria bacterium]|nr:site-2 protease family protein [Candidatus Berkelbacteria bacterium]